MGVTLRRRLGKLPRYSARKIASITTARSHPNLDLRTLGFAAAFAAIFGIATWDTWVAILHIWTTSDQYEHGLLIVLISLYLAYTQRAKLKQLEFPSALTEPFWWTLIPLALLSVLHATDILNLQMFLLPSMLLLGIAAVFGVRVAWLLAFPIMILHSALPGWGPALPYLHSMTVVVSSLMIRATGISAHIDGALVTIPSGSFIIEDGCSGMNYFVIGTSLGAIVAF